ncbi:MAG: hypothetical protein ACHQCF_05050 [Solirubrobacterales bacterium]
MKMDVNVSLHRAAVVAIAVVAVLLVVLMAWIGGEAHYGNCLEKAALQYPVSSRMDPSQGAAREAAISSCSRWP